MRQNQSSTTAANNAVLRAHETTRLEGERICSDPYAVFFLPESLLSATDRSNEMRRHISDWETHFPGVCNAIIARTRFIDDCLEAAIEAGLRQLVLLGAGFDTRALRFEALKNRVTVFELDHPATQQTKLERIAKYVQADLTHVRYVSMDFTTDTLERKLTAKGYDPGLQTLFIWEGVTYYIPAAAVDRTLRFISRNTPSGSGLVFDYFPVSVANGTTTLAEARALRDGLNRIGEEILFGIERDQITDFLKARAFRVKKNFSSTEIKAAYFTGPNRNRSLSDMFLLVLAETNG